MQLASAEVYTIYLDVRSSDLDIVAVSKLHLVKWPLLECLELADHAFTSGFMRLLSLSNQAGHVLGENIITDTVLIPKGHWPQLQSIVYSKSEGDSEWMQRWGESCTCSGWGENCTCGSLCFQFYEQMLSGF